MFDFYVVLAGHDMITDAGGATMWRQKFKAPGLQTKVQKTLNLWKTCVLTGKQFEVFRQKNTETKFSTLQKHRIVHTALKHNKVFWQILLSFQIISVKPKRLLKTQFFEKKASVPVKKISGANFSLFVEFFKP